MVAGAKVQIGLRPVQRWGGESIEYGVSSIGRDELRVAGDGSPLSTGPLVNGSTHCAISWGLKMNLPRHPFRFPVSP